MKDYQGYPEWDPELEAELEDWPDESETTDSDSGKKSPERKNREKAFVELYEAFMSPQEKRSAYRTQCLLDDMFTLLLDLNRGWVYRKAIRYQAAGFSGVDAELALSIGCSGAYDLIREDREKGNVIPYPLAHYLKVAQYKTIDHFRSEFGRLPSQKKKDGDPEEPQEEQQLPKKGSRWLSLEGLLTDADNKYHADRIGNNKPLSCDPFADMRRPRRELDEKCNRLSVLYLRELMNYTGEPQKPLALMYGSILFLLARDSLDEDELSELARKSTKLSSPGWAHRKMGTQNLMELSRQSAGIVRQCYDRSLSWGPDFQRYLQEIDYGNTGERWADIVYTRTYGEKETSNWTESIFKSTVLKCARLLVTDPELREFAEAELCARNKLRKAIEKLEGKETCR